MKNTVVSNNPYLNDILTHALCWPMFLNTYYLIYLQGVVVLLNTSEHHLMMVPTDVVYFASMSFVCELI